MKLTDMACRAAKPKDKAYKLSDGRGLYLFVMKSGGRSWRYDYKIKTDIDRFTNGTYTYGLYPEVPLAEARDLHTRMHKLVSQGIDPNEHKKQEELQTYRDKALTFGRMVEEWLEKYVHDVKPRTFDDTRKRLIADVIPEIGHIPMKEIKPADFLDMLKKIESRGAFEMANRCRQYCSKALRYAVAVGKAERDYTLDIGDALATRRTVHQPALSPDEIPEFLTALEKNDARLYVQTRLALKMLLLVFVRPIELASAEWSEFDFDDKRWVIPAEKTKMQKDLVVPLAKQTIEILDQLKEMNGLSPYVFVNQRDDQKHMIRDTLSKGIRALGFQGRHTAHGFRALALTALQEKLGVLFAVADAQLGHGKKGSLGSAYDRAQFLDQRIPMMQEWANYIDALSSNGKIVQGNFTKRSA